MLYDETLRQPMQDLPALFDEESSSGPSVPEGLLADKSPAHYQYKGSYIMTAVRSGLMIIDQHRADVRIRYERYMEQLRQRQSSTQRLLFPEVVQFPPSEDVVMLRLLPSLSGVGFDLSCLGGGSYSVGGVPSGLEGLSPVSLIRNLVADAAEVGDASLDQLHAALALSLARHAAIPQGQVLSNDEMEHVVSQLFACSDVNHTPDGKTILGILPHQDIEKLLG
jgi:DNA mismatch repair protein MutL